MDSLENILKRCLNKRGDSTLQRKTVITPSFRKEKYHLTVHCARQYPILIDALEVAGVACMPLHRCFEYDYIESQIECESLPIGDWGIFNWHTSYGIRVQTGAPSARAGANWHDIEFTLQAIKIDPKAVSRCLDALMALATNPLLTLTPSGGIRFSCRIPNYLHSKSKRIYVYNPKASDGRSSHEPKVPRDGNGSITGLLGDLKSTEDIYLAVIGEKGYVPWDARHEILIGDILNPPMISKQIIFPVIESFRSELQSIINHKDTMYLPKSNIESEVDTESDLQSSEVEKDKVQSIRNGQLSPLAIKRSPPRIKRPLTLHRCMDSPKNYTKYRLPIACLKDLLAPEHGETLNNLSLTLLNALTFENQSRSTVVHRLRTAIQTFEWQTSQISEQLQDKDYYWHELIAFFAHYKRNADAPIMRDGDFIDFWIPNSEGHTPEETPKYRTSGITVFQLRTGLYPYQTLVDFNNGSTHWNETPIAWEFINKICDEMKRLPHIRHAISTYYKNHAWQSAAHPIETSNVLWVLGMPAVGFRSLWQKCQQFFGHEDEPLSYEWSREDIFKDARVQSVYEGYGISRIVENINQFQKSPLPNKKAVILTSLPVPGITDRPDTLLFDWEDYLIAGDLENLAETIAIREDYERRRDALTPDTSRKEVEEIYGCSPRQANRILQKLRGGAALRVSLREQILECLGDSEKKTADIASAVIGHPKAIQGELKRLVDTEEILRVRWGVYVRNR